MLFWYVLVLPLSLLLACLSCPWFGTLLRTGETTNMMEVAWMVLFGGIGISMIGCGIVDLLEDYSEEKRRRNI